MNEILVCRSWVGNLPFCAIQFSMYKATVPTMAVGVIENHWNFSGFVLWFAVEMCKYMVVVFRTSWDVRCCVETRGATSQEVQQNMLGNNIDALCQAWILRLMFPDLRASASFSACLVKSFCMVLASVGSEKLTNMQQEHPARHPVVGCPVFPADEFPNRGTCWLSGMSKGMQDAFW